MLCLRILPALDKHIEKTMCNLKARRTIVWTTRYIEVNLLNTSPPRNASVHVRLFAVARTPWSGDSEKLEGYGRWIL